MSFRAADAKRPSRAFPREAWERAGLALPVQAVTPLLPNPALADPVALEKSIRFQTVHAGMHLPFRASALLYRGCFEMSGAKRLLAPESKAAAGQRKMPSA